MYFIELVLNFHNWFISAMGFLQGILVGIADPFIHPPIYLLQLEIAIVHHDKFDWISRHQIKDTALMAWGIKKSSQNYKMHSHNAMVLAVYMYTPLHPFYR